MTNISQVTFGDIDREEIRLSGAARLKREHGFGH
jgi:hypothetical protein